MSVKLAIVTTYKTNQFKLTAFLCYVIITSQPKAPFFHVEGEAGVRFFENYEALSAQGPRTVHYG